MKYEIVRMPTDQYELHETLMEYTPFLDAMYSKADEAVFGPISFIKTIGCSCGTMVQDISWLGVKMMKFNVWQC